LCQAERIQNASVLTWGPKQIFLYFLKANDEEYTKETTALRKRKHTHKTGNGLRLNGGQISVTGKKQQRRQKKAS
jgi:hypothetical protein